MTLRSELFGRHLARMAKYSLEKRWLYSLRVLSEALAKSMLHT